MEVSKMPKLALIVASEKMDKLFPAVTLATTAAISGWDVEMFFTFWGLLSLKKESQSSGISIDYKEYEPRFSEAVASGSIPDWRTVLTQGVATGKIRIYACSASLGMFGLKREDLESYVNDIVGAATFLAKAKDSNVSLFIS
jgi:peroxiredoxin family protein